MKWTTSFDFKREARWLLILVTVPFLLALFVLLMWPWLRQPPRSGALRNAAQTKRGGASLGL